MTEKEKAKAYDKAIERTKKLYGNRITKEIFPELKEDDDEKIKKDLIQWVDEFPDTIWRGHYKNDIIAWLEKQGEDKKEINNFDVLPGLYKCIHRMFDGTPDGRLLFEIGNVYKCLSKHDRAEFEVSYGHSVYLEDPVVCKYFIPFESKDEQTSSQTNERTWTIQDAKDGDVIFYDEGWICIFKCIHGIWYSSYCFITDNGEFHTGYERHAVDSTIHGNAHPATKEQRDALMKAINDAGYEWDSEKKELKKKEK